jgi:hypothetical protein
VIYFWECDEKTAKENGAVSDAFTGVPSFLTGAMDIDRARELVRSKATFQASRNLVAAIYRKNAPRKTHDRGERDIDILLAKSTGADSGTRRAASRAEALIRMSPARFEQTAKTETPEVVSAARLARAALPRISALSELGEAIRYNTPPSLTRLRAGSEGRFSPTRRGA